MIAYPNKNGSSARLSVLSVGVLQVFRDKRNYIDFIILCSHQRVTSTLCSHYIGQFSIYKHKAVVEYGITTFSKMKGWENNIILTILWGRTNPTSLEYQLDTY